MTTPNFVPHLELGRYGSKPGGEQAPRRATGGVIIAIHMREYMPENRVEKKTFKRLPSLEKACIRMPWYVLGEETSCFNLFVIVCIIV